jgi:hypothetical protein
MKERVFCEPQSHKAGKGKMIYYFQTRFFRIKDTEYEIIGTESQNGEVMDCVKNLSTGEIRSINRESIVNWFRKEKV